MIGSKLIDSSIWLEFLANSSYQDLIESNEVLFVSSVSIFEIRKKLLKEKIDKEIILKSINFIKARSHFVIPISTQIAEKAAEISMEFKLHTADAFIYTTALLNDCLLITADNDFRGLNSVQVLEKP
ncbi:type II toxin-antitoxin system VapC family toxin [Candidatus Woesearchaeota archaeon]|nr:type II toxin-antitoxin system VapC family toxin [Candidatus Woesearchaeota archaeon]